MIVCTPCAAAPVAAPYHPVTPPVDVAAPSRPSYHFAPVRNWMNDPNGLVFADGEYHLFYQYNPLGDRWGHMSWGHAVSGDLLRWHEMPVAIGEDDRYMIFSGSVVVDDADSSGFGIDGKPPLVAMYTGDRRAIPEIQNQQLAFSNDHGMTWTKYSNNPVIDLGLRAFRDPKVFWYEAKREWVMAAALSDRHQVTFYASTDLRQWHHVGDFGPAGAVNGAWECPDLFPLPVTNVPGEVRWALKVDVFKGGVGSGAQYFVGDFDGRTFTADPAGAARPVDYGKDFYAAASWSHIPSTDGRHLWIAWMNNHEYAQDTPTSPWRGMMSVPRAVSLRRGGDGYALAQRPVAELARWRMRPRHYRNIALQQDSETTVEKSVSASSDIVATLLAGDAAEMGLEVRVGGHERTVIGYDVKRHQLSVDRSRSGRIDFNSRFASRQTAPMPLSGRLTLRILLDSTSIEVFALNGERVLSEQIFPAASSLGLRAYARGGTASVSSLDVWDLSPPGR
jgi:fructan beta-fructosidase